MDRCTGHCCRCFTLNISLEGLKQLVAEFQEPYSEVELDNIQVAQMVIPLSGEAEQEAIRVTGSKGTPGIPRFTCKNLQSDGNCGIYESRPKMCRDYPNTGTCEYSECTRSET